MLAGTLATLCVLSAGWKEENWQWMDAAEDNERRMMLSRPSWAARHTPQAEYVGLSTPSRVRPRTHSIRTFGGSRQREKHALRYYKVADAAY